VVTILNSSFKDICIMFCLLNQGNVGLIFTKGDLKEVSEEVAKYKVKWSFHNYHISCFIVFIYNVFVMLFCF
jgi:hypothetical protein